jgi:hypothetical protein
MFAYIVTAHIPLFPFLTAIVFVIYGPPVFVAHHFDLGFNKLHLDSTFVVAHYALFLLTKVALSQSNPSYRPSPVVAQQA